MLLIETLRKGGPKTLVERLFIQEAFPELLLCASVCDIVKRPVPTCMEPISLERDSAQVMINNCPWMLAGDMC